MRNVLVTGGSRGLGLGIASGLTACGFRAIVVARNESEELLSHRRATELAGAGPDSLPFVGCDLAEIDAIPELVRSLRKDFGPLYGLVNNAGSSIEGVFAMTTIEEIQRLVQLNTVSPIVLTRSVVRAMMADGGGRIVNISSIAASTGYSGLAVYSATKASLIGFTRSLAREVGQLGISVNALAPGFVNTEMTRRMSEAERAKIERRSALKRLVSIADVANAVLFLLSEQARSITGTVLTVDAGSTA